jgi:very-short-patch-repair endonuclease
MGQRQADERIHDLAARQHGVVARSQLLGAGVSAGAIDHRLRRGTLRPIHRGVYRTGPVTARYLPEAAAMLACGPDAALSDRSAAGIWGMMPAPQREAPVDVAGPRSLRGPAAGVRLHRRQLEPDEITQRHGLPLTTPARTILDLASGLGPYPLERVLARAMKREIVACDAVEAMLLRHPHRRGCRTLRTLLDAAAGPAFTRSEPEALFLALLRKARVPRPRTNAVLYGLEVDFFWPDQAVVVEVDGFAYHSQRSTFESDRRRDRILASEGLTVIRVTWRQIQNEPEQILACLCMALGARTSRRGGRGQTSNTDGS